MLHENMWCIEKVVFDDCQDRNSASISWPPFSITNFADKY